MRRDEQVPPSVREYLKLRRALRRAAWRETLERVVTVLAAVGLVVLLVRQCHR